MRRTGAPTSSSEGDGSMEDGATCLADDPPDDRRSRSAVDGATRLSSVAATLRSARSATWRDRARLRSDEAVQVETGSLLEHFRAP